MAVYAVYAGGTGTASSLTKLPSPVSVQVTREQIWSENTGRAQEGEHKAEMMGTSVAEKMTYNIKWGILDSTDYNKITSNMPKGFFYFGVGITAPTPALYYRSEITYDVVQTKGTWYFKDVSVSVIQK